MKSRKRLRLPQILSSVFLALGNFGCGGSSSTQPFPPPADFRGRIARNSHGADRSHGEAHRHCQRGCEQPRRLLELYPAPLGNAELLHP